jgi:hypothetical protein
MNSQEFKREAVLLTQTSGKSIAHIARELGISDTRIIDTRNWLARIVLLPSKQQILLYSVCLYSNPYSNADEHQRKTIARYGQKRAISSTLCTRANTSEQGMSSPPFGSPSFYFEPSQNSSKDTSCLRLPSIHLCTATVQQRLQSTVTNFQICQRGSVVFTD